MPECLVFSHAKNLFLCFLTFCSGEAIPTHLLIFFIFITHTHVRTYIHYFCENSFCYAECPDTTSERYLNIAVVISNSIEADLQPEIIPL